MAKKIKKTKKIKEKTNNKEELFNKITVLISILISIASLLYSMLIRQDTVELTKFTDKPVYYTISLYPNQDTLKSEVSDKYLSINLTLKVDAFELKKKGYLDINYNDVFTKINYYMVYDYSDNLTDYKYMRYGLDDKTTAQLRYDDYYYSLPTKLNYSFTPNKEYCYLLIYTETTTQKNLDLIFFKYYDSDKTFTLDTIFENGKEVIDIKRIEYDTLICKDYFVDLWENDSKSRKEDIEFMFDVYYDLRSKLIF